MSRLITTTAAGTMVRSAPHGRRKSSGDMGFLCFTLGREEYGIDLNLIKQIVKPPPLTWVPKARRSILGIISIRGSVITLLDARLLMGMAPTDWPRSARVLLVEIRGERVGMLVDAVTLVRRVSVADFEEDPALGERVGTEHVLGVIRPDPGVQITIVDIREILAESL